MKIGILTFHKAYNYGAILQTYALYKTLKNFNVECEVIDYCPKSTSTISFKQKIKKLLKHFYEKKKIQAFTVFSKNITFTNKEYHNIEELNDLDIQNYFDKYIVGSDQVWNKNIIKNDYAYFLDFVKEPKKKYSYAASIGNVNFSADVQKIYEQKLMDFSLISIREQSSKKILKYLDNENIKVVSDPTLLLDKYDWLKITSRRLINKKYAFLYTIGVPDNLVKYAKKICKEKNLILINSKKSRAFFRNLNPSDFLSFIYNAEYVFTNSFHGTCFSIIFEKQFVTEVNLKTNSINTRSFDLLKKLGLTNRDMNDISFKIDDKIDYDSVEKIKTEFKNESIDFLNKIINYK